MAENNKTITTHNPMGSFGLPLVISLGGVIMSTLALAIYHFILLKCCLRPRHRHNNNNNPNHNTKNVSCGVHEEILSKIPIIKYSISTILVFGLNQSECSICLGELKNGDLVRVLPTCNHVFHVPCIDAWFKEHVSCPFCRSQIPCDFESILSQLMGSENGGQQRVLVHETSNDDDSSDHHSYQFMDDIEGSSGSTPTTIFHQPPPQPMLLRHSIAVASSRIRTRMPVLKRSWSMDESYLYIATTNIRRDQEMASSTTSCSYTKWNNVIMSLSKSRSLRHSDMASASTTTTRWNVMMNQCKSRSLRHIGMLKRSFSQFKNSRNGRSNIGGILPN